MFKAIRRYYWVTQKFLSRHARIMGQTTMVVLLTIGVYFIFARYIPTPKETTIIGRVGKHTMETLPGDVQQKISQGLVSVDDKGVPTPALASSWDISDDGTVYTFKINQDIIWHDGSRLTPQDITYNFTDVEVKHDDSSVTYTLKEPFAPFFYAVETPLLKGSKYGTEAYRLTKSKVIGGTIQSLTLESEMERVIYKFYPTEASVVTAYKLGEINTIDNLSYVPQELSQDDTSHTQASDESHKIAALFINNNDVVLGSKSARQGLAYAIKDKSFGNTRALSPISKKSWAYNDLIKEYEFDPEHAKTLFTQDLQNTDNLKIELKTVLQYLETAESIAQDWRDNLGIQVDVKVVSGVTNDYQVILADYTPPRDPDQYTIWHSTQPTNFTHYSSLKVDKLLEDGRRTLDQKLRTEIYQDFQRFLLEDSPAIFLFDTETYTISRKPLL